ncbi:MAG: hypothetical protein AAF639_47295, partial [Chloroflexota bacterium]
SGERAAILIWTGENAQADWFVNADDGESLKTILKQLWPIDEVGKSFYGYTNKAKTILEELQQIM